MKEQNEFIITDGLEDEGDVNGTPAVKKHKEAKNEPVNEILVS